jgi:predicted kinase
MALPTLVVVSGPAGTGKTTLAHELARAIGCPAICRDEIKEGMVHAVGEFQPARADPLTVRTLGVFFDVVRTLLSAGVTVVAEAAFQDKVWTPNLEPLSGLARLCVVQCHTDAAVARERVQRRAASRTAHADETVLEDGDYFDRFVRLASAAPAITVDTTNGYEPDIRAVVAFINGKRRFVDSVIELYVDADPALWRDESSLVANSYPVDLYPRPASAQSSLFSFSFSSAAPVQRREHGDDAECDSEDDQKLDEVDGLECRCERHGSSSSPTRVRLSLPRQCRSVPSPNKVSRSTPGGSAMKPRS